MGEHIDWALLRADMAAGMGALSEAVYSNSKLPVREREAARWTIALINDCAVCQDTRARDGAAAGIDEGFYGEIASWKTVVDLQGPMNGRAYFGGFHGLSALNGMNAPMASQMCGQSCAAYEEHVHPFSADNTSVLGRDIRAIALTTAGDLIGRLHVREVRVVRHDRLGERRELDALSTELADLAHDLVDGSLAAVEHRAQLDRRGFDDSHRSLLGCETLSRKTRTSPLRHA